MCSSFPCVLLIVGMIRILFCVSNSQDPNIITNTWFGVRPVTSHIPPLWHPPGTLALLVALPVAWAAVHHGATGVFHGTAFKCSWSLFVLGIRGGGGISVTERPRQPWPPEGWIGCGWPGPPAPLPVFAGVFSTHWLHLPSPMHFPPTLPEAETRSYSLCSQLKS